MKWRCSVVLVVLAVGCGGDTVAAGESNSAASETDDTSETAGEDGSSETGEPPPPSGPEVPERKPLPPIPDSCPGTAHILGQCTTDDMDLLCDDHGMHVGVPLCPSKVGGPCELGLCTGIWACGCYSPSGLMARDLDHDGADELLVACSGANTHVQIWRGRHDGRLSCGQAHAVAGGGPNLWIRDVDEDGLDDIVSLGWSGFVTILFATAPGEYAAQVPLGVLAPLLPYDPGVELDIDADGRNELLLIDATTWDPAPITVLDVEAGAITVAELDSPAAQAVAAADIDGDGRRDLIGYGDAYWWARSSALGLEPAQPLEGIANYGGWGDFNGDGLADFAHGGAPEPAIQFGLGDGSFTPAQLQADPDAPDHAGGWPALVRDFDGDGRADLLLNGYGLGWSLWRSTPDGLRFDSHANLYENIYFAAGDFDGDGRGDLASSPPLAAETNGQVIVWRAQP